MIIITVKDEDNVPLELLEARDWGYKIQCKAAPGIWVDLDDPDFRCGVTYRILEETHD